MSEIQKAIDAIGRLQPTKWWIHETMVCRTTNIRPWDGKSVRQWLTLVLLSIKKSYIGNKKEGIKTGLPAIDVLSRESNQLSIHCLQHGKGEPFSTTGDLKATKASVIQIPRYFSFGTDVIDIKIQMSILRSVTGKDPNLDPATAIKRASLWKGWYLRTPNNSRQFVLQHLPAIAREYAHAWGLAELIADDDAIPPRLLQQIGDQIRSLLHYSNTAPVARLRNGDAVRVPLDESSMTMNNKAGSPSADDDAQPSPPKRRRRESSLPSPGALPSSLKASELKDTSVNELAAIEHCLWLLQ
jgi:hypothetical protein